MHRIVSRVRLLRPCSKCYSTAPAPIVVNGVRYAPDDYTNAPPTILAKVEQQKLHLTPNHPLSILKNEIQRHLHAFDHFSALDPVVSVSSNFDDLGFPPDHPGRSKTDSYYLNSESMLRTHTSAHEVEFFRRGEEKWLLSADVYRRDEIDSCHYPVFHQMEGAYIVSKEEGDNGIAKMEAENQLMREQAKGRNLVMVDETQSNMFTSPTNPVQAEFHSNHQVEVMVENLKLQLNGLVWRLFGELRRKKEAAFSQDPNEVLAKVDEPLQVRWIEATFPWTSPSYEVEVFFEGKWLEILGCGIVKQDTLNRSGPSNLPPSPVPPASISSTLPSGVPDKLGWAFGLGLERIAMILFSIPDIRLFWSTDQRFLSQFQEGQITIFKPYSKYPECYKDFSFWTSTGTEEAKEKKSWHENDFCEVVRNVAGDLVEGVSLIDEFVHPKTGRRSVCYRLNYRSMDRSLSNKEVNELQAEVEKQVLREMDIEAR